MKKNYLSLLTFLLISSSFYVIAQDKVTLNNISGGEIGLLADGMLNKSFVNDKTFVSISNPLNIGSFTKANGLKTNEIMAFSADRPMEVYTNVPWTSGTDNINMTFANKILFPITIWVIYGDFDSVVTKVSGDLLAASIVFNDEKVGFDFATVSFINATANPLAPNYYVYHSTGTDPAALKTDIGYVSDRINLYYCKSINISGAEYTNAGLALSSKDVVIMGSTAQPYVLPHEIGHTFNLAHITGLTGFDNTNMMTQSGGLQMKYFTEGQILRMHLSSNSALNFIYNARPGKLLRTCGPTSTTATNICPELQKRIWADGSMPPNISEQIAQRIRSTPDEIAMDWLKLSCFHQEYDFDARDEILKHTELLPYFTSIINNGLNSNALQDIEWNAGILHDQITRALNDKKPEWVVEEYEKKLRSVAREHFIKEQVNLFTLNYKSQALKGLAILNESIAPDGMAGGIQLNAFPNPSLKDKFTIGFTLINNSDFVVLSIFDQNGKNIIRNEYLGLQAGTYREEIETNKFSAGIYFYQLKSNKICFFDKIVISK